MAEGETYGMRFAGGPDDGATALIAPGTPLHAWPLPDRLDLESFGGHYEKVRESQLTTAHPGVMRGAEYEWRPDQVTPSELGGTDG